MSTQVCDCPLSFATSCLLHDSLSRAQIESTVSTRKNSTTNWGETVEVRSRPCLLTLTVNYRKLLVHSCRSLNAMISPNPLLDTLLAPNSADLSRKSCFCLCIEHEVICFFVGCHVFSSARKWMWKNCCNISVMTAWQDVRHYHQSGPWWMLNIHACSDLANCALCSFCRILVLVWDPTGATALLVQNIDCVICSLMLMSRFWLSIAKLLRINLCVAWTRGGIIVVTVNILKCMRGSIKVCVSRHLFV